MAGADGKASANGPSPEHEKRATAGQDLGFDLPEPARVSRTRALAIAAVGALVLGGAFVAAYVPRQKARAALEAGAQGDEGARLRVEVVSPKPLSSDNAMLLPGTVQPLEETTVYSRANGYVKKWFVDIGERVDDG